MKYYLTTPIYYVNAAPHIGHTYTTIAADVIKRFKYMQGYDHVVLTTGTDEHGQKVERAAKAAGKAPEEFTTAVAAEFRKQWDAFGLQYDHFVRTSEPRHHKSVQYSSASMIVMTRSVTAGSAGSGECADRARMQQP